MRPFTARITYDAPIADVAAMLADPAYVERKVAASRPVSSSFDVTGDAGGAFTVTTQRALATPDRVPAAAQKLIGSTVEMRLVERWDAAAADGSRSGAIELQVIGKPASATGTATLSPESDERTSLVYQGELEVKVPLVGGKIEAQAVDQVQRVLDSERRVGTAWLAEK